MSIGSSNKLLFKLDEWSIYKDMYHGHGGRVTAFAHHDACTSRLTGSLKIGERPTNCWHTGDTRQSCILCNAIVPDEIQGLIYLYQYGGE